MSQEFFPKKSAATPTIYAYELPNDSSRKGLLKVGDTNRTAQQRIKEQIGAARSAFKIVAEQSAMRNDGSSFRDYEVHEYLRKKGIKNPDGEWFVCTKTEVESAIKAVREGKSYELSRDKDFAMRPEQKEAVNKTARYFESYKGENPDKTPHFLWNAKMRFGKTFATYQLAKKQGWTKILVLTFKPAVQSAWQEDLLTHVDFEGWQFVSRSGLSYEDIDPSKPFVCFGSFQDYLGKNTSTGGIKTKNEWVQATNWDCVVFDEYHYGAWRENSKDLFESEDAKEEWMGPDNPYESLPRMVMLTYQMPDSIKEVAIGGEFNEFDLNVFFEATGIGEGARFRMERYVQKWLYVMHAKVLI